MELIPEVQKIVTSRMHGTRGSVTGFALEMALEIQRAVAEEAARIAEQVKHDHPGPTGVMDKYLGAIRTHFGLEEE